MKTTTNKKSEGTMEMVTLITFFVILFIFTVFAA